MPHRLRRQTWRASVAAVAGRSQHNVARENASDSPHPLGAGGVRNRATGLLRSGMAAGVRSATCTKRRRTYQHPTLNRATSMHAITVSTRGLWCRRSERGRRSSSGCTWKTNRKKALKWSNISAKKYHHSPMLGDVSSARWSRPSQGAGERRMDSCTHQQESVSAVQPLAHGTALSVHQRR